MSLIFLSFCSGIKKEKEIKMKQNDARLLGGCPILSVCLPLTHSTTDRHTDRGSFHLFFEKKLYGCANIGIVRHTADKKNVWTTKLITGKDI
jgi:hypothetical protein